MVSTILALGAGLAIAVQLRHGFSARDEPWSIEEFIARRVRRLAIPSAAADASNPIPMTGLVLQEARAHFADHCASCHANNGSGDTAIGRSLYPKVPDMREPSTQSLTDGELFYIIHNGVRFTGMPAWGPADPAMDKDSWKLVHFIRHLPNISTKELAEMESLNPKSKHGAKDEADMQGFLNGENGKEAPILLH